MVPRNKRAVNSNLSGIQGFTLIELSVVVAIIGILYLSIVPMYGSTIQRAKETALKENLQILRKTLDLYFKDHEEWPKNLESLVKEGYIRDIPVDPITRRKDSWISVPSKLGENDIYDIQSGAEGKSIDDVPFNSF